MTVTSLPEHDEQQATADQLLAAQLQLEVAVDQLVQPSQERLDRAPDNDPDVQDTTADDTKRIDQERRRDSRIFVALHQRHADARRRHDGAAMRRVIDQLTRHGDRVRHDKLERERQAVARAATTAELPSLLEQLVDAVAASARGAGITPRSVHRLPFDPTAAELLAHIERTTRHRSGEPDLVGNVRAWAAQIVETQNSTELPAAAALAEAWVQQARAILSPGRTFDIDADCPVCANRWVWLPDDTGQRVRRGALQVNTDERVARCINPGCTGRWTEPFWPLLIAAIGQDRQERAG